jgi:hypothetical protein
MWLEKLLEDSTRGMGIEVRGLNRDGLLKESLLNISGGDQGNALASPLLSDIAGNGTGFVNNEAFIVLLSGVRNCKTGYFRKADEQGVWSNGVSPRKQGKWLPRRH